MLECAVLFYLMGEKSKKKMSYTKAKPVEHSLIALKRLVRKLSYDS